MLRRTHPTPPPNEESFHRLVDLHAARLFRVAFAVVRDAHLAEDVVQDTIIRAWQNLDSFRGDGAFDGWLSSIAHRTAVSYLRRIKDTAVDPADLHAATSTVDIEASSIAANEATAVFLAIDELDELSRRIILLREVDGLSYAAIAAQLDVPVPTVKTRLLRARRFVQTRLTTGVAT